MKIAILGTGNVGRALARSTTRAGHDVVLSSSNPASAQGVAAAIGARVAASNAEAVSGAEVVILAVPTAVVADVVSDLRTALDGRIVVDVTNRPTPDPDGKRISSIAEELQALAPQARVVKAFNTAFAARQEEPNLGDLRADAYVAADDEDAKRQVLRLAESIGFRPIDVGPLAQARTLEGMAWIHISLQMQHQWPWQSAWKIVGPTGQSEG